MRIACVLVLWAVSGPAACKDAAHEARPAPPRGVAPSTAPVEPPVAQPPPPPPAPTPFRWPDEQPAAPAPAAEPPEKKKERDYPAELLAALGDPTSCLQPRAGADAPNELTIELEAHVVGAGSVSRSYVRSAQLRADEIECIRKRLSALRLGAPIDDAPREVRATLRLALKSAAKTGT